MGVDLRSVHTSAPQGPPITDRLLGLNSELIMMILDFVRDVRTAAAHRDLRTNVETLLQRKWKHFDFNLMPYVKEILPPMQPPMAVRPPAACQDLKMIYEGIHAHCKEMGKAFLAVHAKNQMQGSFEPASFLALENAARQAENDRNLVRIWPRIAKELRIDPENKNSNEIKAWLLQNTDLLARINTLHLTHLKLTMIPEELSSLHLPNLHHLYLCHNRLKTLPKGFGAQWPNLEQLFLSHNTLSELPADFGTNWVRMQNMNLSYNELETLSDDFGRSWLRLEELMLYTNKLKTLPNDFGAKWNLLSILVLNDNLLKALPANFGANWNQLVSLDIFDNLLTDLPKGFGSHWNQLESLYMSENQIRRLPERFGTNWPWWSEKRAKCLEGNPILDPPPPPPAPIVNAPQKIGLTAAALHLLSTALLAGFSAYLFGWRPTCAVGSIYLMHRYANRS